LAASELGSTHCPPHETKPAGHAHTPALHTSPPLHAMAQAPQFSGSVAVSSQLCPQAVNGAVQVATQAPAWQKLVAPPHALPHIPQLSGSPASERQMPPQSWVPVGHVHEPSTQVVPCSQVIPQPPQFLGSVPVSTHWPPQSVVPGAVQAHLPPLHVSADEHAVVQPPQWP